MLIYYIRTIFLCLIPAIFKIITVRPWTARSDYLYIRILLADSFMKQLAVTRYKVLQRGKGYSLLEVSLDTGRKNQIRVHMKDLGHPIAGDRRYGAKSSPIHRMALHAQTLKFAHPITRRLMEFTTPVPSSFASMV